MSRKPAKRPVERRPATEYEVWQRIQQRGKGLFLTRFTLILGCLLAVIVLPLQFFLSKHRPNTLELTGAAVLCLCVGYIGGSLLWQRGEGILRKPNPTNRYRR
ncbi:MAG TPA: hypothetical protein VGC07_11075 [Granulicella sp.]